MRGNVASKCVVMLTTRPSHEVELKSKVRPVAMAMPWLVTVMLARLTVSYKSVAPTDPVPYLMITGVLETFCSNDEASQCHCCPIPTAIDLEL